MTGPDIDVLRSRIGATFRVEVPESGEAVTVELTELSDLAPHAVSLLFSGPAEPMLEQATYELADTDGDSMSLFIVPLGPRAGMPMVYEAIINNEPAS